MKADDQQDAAVTNDQTDEVLREIVDEINANVEDPTWQAWSRYSHQLQRQVSEREEVIRGLIARKNLIDKQAETSSPRALPAGAVTTTNEAVEPPGSPWLTPRQAADYLRISLRKLETLREDTPTGTPRPWRKLGRTVRWQREEMGRWIDAVTRAQGRRRRR